MRKKVFKEENLVLLYDSKFVHHPRKLNMHWLGSYIVNEITDGGKVRLATLSSEYLPRYVNGIWLKPYRDDPLPTHTKWLYGWSIGSVQKEWRIHRKVWCVHGSYAWRLIGSQKCQNLVFGIVNLEKIVLLPFRGASKLYLMRGFYQIWNSLAIYRDTSMHKGPLKMCRGYKYDIRGFISSLFFMCECSALRSLISKIYSFSMSRLDSRFKEELHHRGLGHVVPPSMTTMGPEEDPVALVTETPVPMKIKKG